MILSKTKYATKTLRELLNLADDDTTLNELGRELMYRLEALQESTGEGTAEHLTHA